MTSELRDQERSTDLYETLPGCPPAPLATFSPPNTDALLRAFRAKSTPFTRLLAHTLGRLAGAQGFFGRLNGPVLERCLRRTHTRPVFHPLLNSATVALEDDPRCRDLISRSVTLLLAAREFYLEMKAGHLAPEAVKGQPCEMGQFPNLFSTSLIPTPRGTRLFKSESTSQIAVCARGRIFVVELGRDNWSGAVIARALRAILAAAAPTPRAERGIGFIACASINLQHQLFPQIEALGPNVDALSTLRHAFLTLCLDETAPISPFEAARLTHIGDPGNRWFRSSFQLVVFGNGRACTICAFSCYLDGNVMGRACSEIQRQALRHDPAGVTTPPTPAAPDWRELKWELRDAWLESAQRDAAVVQDTQDSTFELAGLGADYFEQRGLKPVPAFTIAMQLALKRLTGRVVRLDQFLDMSRYRCMGVKATDVTTPETARFITALTGTATEAATTAALLNDAIESQVRQCRTARSELGFNTALGLFFSSRSALQRAWLSAFRSLVGKLAPSHEAGAEALISHIKICPGVILVGRPGLRMPRGLVTLHYQLMPDRAVLTLMTNADGKITNQIFVDALRSSCAEVAAAALDPSRDRESEPHLPVQHRENRPRANSNATTSPLKSFG